ncbi:unnamed protein product [Schistosoma mattheei]|uniref:Protein TIC 214 n=1 Tax=Schistosoma mattheei TaxID=31246 RepID=A0A183P3R2_9TREM|nr:unnamed protein product [Schistosoma mattheei]VDP47612.1 unnamed protein product [Schistosoma mattheei]
MNKQSLNTITPLLCITIHIENYIELYIHDDYSLPILQYRYEQYYNKPWKQPKKCIKTKLILTYTSLILKNGSWWPYRYENIIQYKTIQKIILFNQHKLQLAIGLYDDDYIEKQFLIITTKNITDIDKLIQLIDTQLLIWKYTFNKQIDYYPYQLYKRKLINNNKLQLIPLKNKALNRKVLIDKNPMIPMTNHVIGLNSLRNTSFNQLNEKIIDKSNGILEINYNNPQSNHHYNEHKSILHMYNNINDHDLYNDKRIIEPIPSTSNNNNNNHNHNKHRKEHKMKKEKEENKKIKSKLCQTDSYYIENNNIKSWEVDIKHVRYDPIQGNILDDNGSVYLYSAHEID